jgi:transposase-like protein
MDYMTYEQVAARLGMARSTLVKKLREYQQRTGNAIRPDRTEPTTIQRHLFRADRLSEFRRALDAVGGLRPRGRPKKAM